MDVGIVWWYDQAANRLPLDLLSLSFADGFRVFHHNAATSRSSGASFVIFYVHMWNVWRCVMRPTTSDGFDSLKSFAVGVRVRGWGWFFHLGGLRSFSLCEDYQTTV
jgi:hypothetical protein